MVFLLLCYCVVVVIFLDESTVVAVYSFWMCVRAYCMWKMYNKTRKNRHCFSWRRVSWLPAVKKRFKRKPMWLTARISLVYWSVCTCLKRKSRNVKYSFVSSYFCNSAIINITATVQIRQAPCNSRSPIHSNSKLRNNPLWLAKIAIIYKPFLRLANKTQQSTWGSFKTSADIMKPQWCNRRSELTQNCTLWKHGPCTKLVPRGRPKSAKD